MNVRRLLLVTNEGGSDANLIALATEVAATHSAQLTVMEVLPEAGLTEELLDGTISPADLASALRGHRQQELEQLCIAARRRLPQGVEVKVLTGIPFIEIIREAVNGDYGLIIKAAAGNDQPGDAQFGSTDMHLLRKSPQPVWIQVPDRSSPVKRLLAAVDVLNPAAETPAFNEQILTLANWAAETFHAELDVISAWHVAGAEQLERSVRPIVGEQEMAQLRARLEETARRRQERLKRWYEERFPQSDRPGWHLLGGSPRQLIVQWAWNHDVDLIVMGTVGRTGIQGFLIGNTAEAVLSAMDRSVLAIKPDGFVTPVDLMPSLEP